MRGGESGCKSLGAKAADRQTNRTGGASGVARNPSGEHLVGVIILVIYKNSVASGSAKKFLNILAGKKENNISKQMLIEKFKVKFLLH